MSWKIIATKESGADTTVTIINLPDECPLCHAKGAFSPLSAFYNSGNQKLEIVYRCPSSKCYEAFFGYYEQLSSGHHYLKRTAPQRHIPRVFSKTINEISPEFSEIYNQALRGEDDGLDQICGPGYRKSLEFLIKDYLISRADDVETKEAIKNEALGTSIANRIQDANIKGVAKRAAWLGNDETHYVRKWGEKDLQDLKKLIDLTVHWMEAEALTAELIRDMPDGSVAEIKIDPKD